MQSVDVTDVKDVALKRDFFGVLPQAIPQFPRVTPPAGRLSSVDSCGVERKTDNSLSDVV